MFWPNSNFGCVFRYTLSSLLFANLFISELGSKGTIVMGLCMYCFYSGAFLVSHFLTKGSTLQVRSTCSVFGPSLMPSRPTGVPCVNSMCAHPRWATVSRDGWGAGGGDMGRGGHGEPSLPIGPEVGGGARHTRSPQPPMRTRPTDHVANRLYSTYVRRTRLWLRLPPPIARWHLLPIGVAS